MQLQKICAQELNPCNVIKCNQSNVAAHCIVLTIYIKYLDIKRIAQSKVIIADLLLINLTPRNTSLYLGAHARLDTYVTTTFDHISRYYSTQTSRTTISNPITLLLKEKN